MLCCRPGSYYTIRIGEHNRNKQEGTEEDIPARRVVVHPDYNTPYLNNDIALIQLIRPAKLNARVGTVCLPAHHEVVPTSAKCFITGDGLFFLLLARWLNLFFFWQSGLEWIVLFTRWLIGSDGSFAGWGKISHPGSSHYILQQARLPPVTNDVCARKLATSHGTLQNCNKGNGKHMLPNSNHRNDYNDDDDDGDNNDEDGKNNKQTANI